MILENRRRHRCVYWCWFSGISFLLLVVSINHVFSFTTTTSTTRTTALRSSYALKPDQLYYSPLKRHYISRTNEHYKLNTVLLWAEHGVEGAYSEGAYSEGCRRQDKDPVAESQDDYNNISGRSDATATAAVVAAATTTTTSVVGDGSSSRSSDARRHLYRSVSRTERNTRLPVWPVWSGVLIWIASKIFGNAVGAKLENVWTGRVCPNFFVPEQTSPFIMLVHHCHSFAPWDFIRWIQSKFILPEGFPAHPHRGFVTLTYFLEGGFVHRDSMGCKQVYGKDTGTTDKYNQYYQYHSQWLNTGAGILHEEMFHFPKAAEGTNKNTNPIAPMRQELYQLWINLPAAHKLGIPHTVLLGDEQEENIENHSAPAPAPAPADSSNDSAPSLATSSPSLSTSGTTPIVKTECTVTRVLAGSYHSRTSTAPVLSNLTVLHVTLLPTSNKKAPSSSSSPSEWIWNVPDQYSTLMVYVRQGTDLRAVISSNNNQDNNSRDSSGGGGGGSSEGKDSSTVALLPVHHMVYFEATGEVLKLQSDTGGADVIVLAGQPLPEPCVASGTMVMNTAQEIDEAFRDYKIGLFGIPWNHELTDSEWKRHVQQHPSAYYSR